MNHKSPFISSACDVVLPELQKKINIAFQESLYTRNGITYYKSSVFAEKLDCHLSREELLFFAMKYIQSLSEVGFQINVVKTQIHRRISRTDEGGK